MKKTKEEELITTYDQYITRLARAYLWHTNSQLCNYDDIKSEATLAFLKTIRRWNFSDTLGPYELALVYNAVRSAMRACVWSVNGERNKNRSFQRRTICFTEMTPEDQEFDEDVLDFLTCEDDYSDVEMRDLIDRLPPVERDTLRLLLQGYSQTDIARIRHTTRKNVVNTVLRIRQRLKDIA